MLVNPDYIGAYMLEQGQDMVITFESVKREMVTGSGGKKEECTVAHLRGQKPFIVNRTNGKMITKVLGSPYIEGLGRQVSSGICYYYISSRRKNRVFASSPDAPGN